MTCDLLFNEHEAYVEPIHNQCDLLFLLSRIKLSQHISFMLYHFIGFPANNMVGYIIGGIGAVMTAFCALFISIYCSRR